MAIGRRDYVTFLVALMATSLTAAEGGDSDSPLVQAAPPLSARLPGMTIAAKAVVLGSVQIGTIDTLKVKEGDRVHKGEVLFELDGDVYRAAVDLSRARAESTVELDLARTRLTEAQRIYNRICKLRETGAAPQEEYDQASNQLSETILQVQFAEFEQAQAKRQLAYDVAKLAERSVRSPLDGYVVELLKQAGESVDEADEVMKLVQTDPLHVQVDCPIQWLGRVRVGDDAEVEPCVVPSPARRAKVIFASKAADAASHTFRVKLELPNADDDWVAGMKVWVRFGAQTAAAKTAGSP